MTDLESPPDARVDDDRLRDQLAEAAAHHAELLKQKAEAEQALSLARSEKEALARKVQDLDAELGETVVAAAESAAKHRVAVADLTERTAQLEKELAARTAGEEAQRRDGEALKATLSGRITALEGERETLVQKVSALEKREAAKVNFSGRIAALEAEKQALIEKLSAAEAREAAQLRDREASRSNLSGRIAALEAEKQALVEKLSAVEKQEAARLRDREASKVNFSGRIAALEAEKHSLAQRLAAAESARDSARSEAAGLEETLRAEAAEQRARAERLQAEAEAHKEFETRLTEEGSRLRAGLVDKIGRLESEAALAEKTFAELLAKRAETEEALTQARGEAREASETLAKEERNYARALAEALRAPEALRVALDEQVARTRSAEAAVESAREELNAQEAKAAEKQKDHAAALTEATDREDALRASLDTERRRAEQLEKDIEEGTRERAELLDRISRLEAEGERALAQAKDDAEAAKSEAERTREELAAHKADIAGLKEAHSAALADAASREDGLRQALDAEGRRAEQLEKDLGAFVEGEAKLLREHETSRAEWSDRVRLLEDEAAQSRTALEDLLARHKEAEDAVASLQAERETLVTQLQEIEQERDLARNALTRQEESPHSEPEDPGRVGHDNENADTVRAELMARIARLEANEAITEKARTELLNRKRDSDRALAAAQKERAALLEKLAIAERARDQG